MGETQSEEVKTASLALTGHFHRDWETDVTSFWPTPKQGTTCAAACLESALSKFEIIRLGSWLDAFTPEKFIKSGNFKCTAKEHGSLKPGACFIIETSSRHSSSASGGNSASDMRLGPLSPRDGPFDEEGTSQVGWVQRSTSKEGASPIPTR